jgi:2-oxoisovalerate dehydrogenase E1 component
VSLERLREAAVRFRDRIREPPSDTEASAPLPFDRKTALELFESMLLARHLDVLAHELRAEGVGQYTIASAGHEGNVVLGRLTRIDDPTLLHYRSAACVLERSRQAAGQDMVGAIALSLVAAEDEPLCSGRHKVFGSKALGIIPQTSTIASHLPRAVGLAFGLDRRTQLGLAPPTDAIAVASFGDASINHSTALGAFNAAGWVAHQNLKLPLLLICEDNGLGISVRSPPGWVAARLRALTNVRYFAARGWDLRETWTEAARAVDYCRKLRLPVVLHITCHRLLGHAGSDVDSSYRSAAELGDAMDHDPVLCAAVSLVRAGVVSPKQALELDDRTRARVQAAGTDARRGKPLSTLAQVMLPIAMPERIQAEPASPAKTSGDPARLTLAQGINLALAEALDRYPELLLFGEDVAKKGGVYGVTKGLLGRGGPARVFNTLLDEQTILGLALGTATLGLLPVAEIQYLAYVHNAIDQLRGEALTLPFFSNGAYTNPFVLRIAGLAYQKGFGGHFHNDNALAALREIPGLIVVAPARGDDAIELFRAAFALARRHRRPVVVIEPIALYHERDLLTPGDGQWLTTPPATAAAWLEPRCYGPAQTEVLIATYANGVRLALRAARTLEREHGIGIRVLDLRWLAPLPVAAVARELAGVERLLIVDEGRRTGGVAESLIAGLVDAGSDAAILRVTGEDCYVPLGRAAERVLVREADIVDAAHRLVKR